MPEHFRYADSRLNPGNFPRTRLIWVASTREFVLTTWLAKLGAYQRGLEALDRSHPRWKGTDDSVLNLHIDRETPRQIVMKAIRKPKTIVDDGNQAAAFYFAISRREPIDIVQADEAEAIDSQRRCPEIDDTGREQAPRLPSRSLLLRLTAHSSVVILKLGSQLQHRFHGIMDAGRLTRCERKEALFIHGM
jgi:hypothetical protein